MNGLSRRRLFRSEHAFKLGTFGANCRAGVAFITAAPERWKANWDENVRLAKMADDAGLDFMLPIARWKGYGGELDYQGAMYETMTWATGLLSQTRHITCFATVHVPIYHPVVAAKQMVTADTIGNGRFGLNIVCGWNEDEFDMFGVTLREHDERYDYAQEWIDIVNKLWSAEEDFEYHGRFFNMTKAKSAPLPVGQSRPILMNAGSSPVGQAFAARNCDAYFGVIRLETIEVDAARIRQIKLDAQGHGNSVEAFSAGTVVCRPTRKEAEDYVRYCTREMADWGSVEGLLKSKKFDWTKLSPDEQIELKVKWATGQGGMIVGSPDDVAKHFETLHAAGLRGYGMAFVNYLDELPYVVQEVLPRMERLGLRAPGA